MARKEKAAVLTQEKLADNIYSMWLQTSIAESAVPGQFISVYTNDKTKLLPRPFGICEIDKEQGRIRIVYRVTGKNTGTEQFSNLLSGSDIFVLGPLGNGYPLDVARNKDILILGGGTGVPPLLELAKQLDCRNKMIVIGYRTNELLLKEDFEKQGAVYIATNDGSVGTKGTVMDAIREYGLKADLIYACGPVPMLRAIKQYAEEQNISCYISLEERMACGIGVCLGCVCKTSEVDEHSHVHNRRICKDGPVFLSTEVII